ncbi:MAG: SIS domain-containing protein [Ostreibacterium sp.]
MTLDTFNLNKLILAGTQDTVKEITQQADCWMKIDECLDTYSDTFYALIAEQLQSSESQVTFCGAGTSAYIGQIISEILQPMVKAAVRFIPTTDIVSCPDAYFSNKSQGLLFSFARSGNSPESLDTADKVSQLASQIVQINITCNPDGALANRQEQQSHCCLMPKETHDKSFVMTSSFSTMLLFTDQLIRRALRQHEYDLSAVAEVSRQFNQKLLAHPSVQVAAKSHRIVYLGSNALYGAARESALKALEMTNGLVVTMAETALGFRHGPKSMINHETTVCLFISSHAYTQQFDRDMLLELLDNGHAQQVIAVAPQSVAITLPTHHKLQVIAFDAILNDYPDTLLSVLHVQVAQIIGLALAMQYQISPDNPCPSGEVNRVVQGVTLYSFTTQ